jgi:predicted secreted protein
MARVTGKNTTLLVKDSTSASRVLSGRANQATLSFASEAVDATAFGESYRFRIADGIKDWTLSISGVWDGAASQVDEILYGILAACTSACYGPGGSTAGLVQYSGCCILNTYEVAGTLEGAVTWSAEFAAAGSLTRATWA